MINIIKTINSIILLYIWYYIFNGNMPINEFINIIKYLLVWGFSYIL